MSERLVTFYKTIDRTFVPVAFHHLGLEAVESREILQRVIAAAAPTRFELHGVIVRVEAGRPPPEVPVHEP